MSESSTFSIKKVKTIDKTFIRDIESLLDKGTTWEIEQGKRFLDNPDNVLFIAYIENNIAGFLTAHRLQRLDKRKAEVLLYEISVSEHFRKKRIGTALLEKLKRWAAQVAADEIWVLTNKSNIAAMALYSSMGGTKEAEDEQMFTFKIK